MNGLRRRFRSRHGSCIFPLVSHVVPVTVSLPCQRPDYYVLYSYYFSSRALSPSLIPLSLSFARLHKPCLALSSTQFQPRPAARPEDSRESVGASRTLFAAPRKQTFPLGTKMLTSLNPAGVLANHCGDLQLALRWWSWSLLVWSSCSHPICAITMLICCNHAM